MILGQSAAVAAELAIDQNIPLQKLSYDDLKEALTQRGQRLSLDQD